MTEWTKTWFAIGTMAKMNNCTYLVSGEFVIPVSVNMENDK